MKQGPSFTELIDRLNGGDEEAAAQVVREFEPAIRRELRFRLRDSRARLELDSMDISQSVLSNFFVRVAARQYDLKEPGDFVRLLVTMTRNKVAERLRSEHRQRRDSRRTVHGVEKLALVSQEPSPSRVLQGKELLQQVRERLGNEERQLVNLRCHGLSWDEVARAVGGSADARRKQLARAIDDLVHKLKLD